MLQAYITFLPPEALIMPITLYVDADACPVKDEIARVAQRHKITAIMVSNSWMRFPQSPYVEAQIVESGLDKADDWIAEQSGPTDVVITADIPLAERCLKKGAQVMGHNGKAFDEESIGMAMAMRDLNAQLRDMGEISGGNPSFQKKDRSRFLNTLENTIQGIKRRL
ncbi:YaiI/YqxD family protein [Magnetococcus sp. PR-3]|uniref:YaiI/YqxD family protein n=1 Tax=Magnetococcus sp. PR-3 TaxID=3120355 RepID=UPI002FCE0DD8